MQGINVISSEQLTEFSTPRTVGIIMVLIVIMLVVKFTVDYFNGGDDGLGNIVGAIIGGIIAIIITVLYYKTNLFKVELPYYKYTCVISDDVTVNELSSMYKIIEIMDNNTYIITDKLDYDGE